MTARDVGNGSRAWGRWAAVWTLLFGAVAAVGGCSLSAPTAQERWGSLPETAAISILRDGEAVSLLHEIDALSAALVALDEPCVCNDDLLRKLQLEQREVPRRQAMSVVDLLPRTVGNKSGKLTGGVGCAVPVSRDGYFLTARHVARAEKNLYVLCPGDDGLCTFHKAEVVWESSAGSECGFSHPPDLAIVRAEVVSARVVEVSDERDCIPGKRIVGGRGANGSAKSGECPYFAGQVCEVERYDGCPYTMLVARAPCGPGDSGGPVLTADGKLAGVLAARNLLSADRYSYFWRVEPGFVERIVAEDRARRNEDALLGPTPLR